MSSPTLSDAAHVSQDIWGLMNEHNIRGRTLYMPCLLGTDGVCQSESEGRGHNAMGINKEPLGIDARLRGMYIEAYG